jgi:hypothetical protein
MYLESAASNSATKYSSGTVQAPSVTKKFAAISPRARRSASDFFFRGSRTVAQRCDLFV